MQSVSDLVIGVLMGVFGMVGLVLASGATDDQIYVFGLSLFLYGFVFILNLIRRHFNREEAARHG